MTTMLFYSKNILIYNKDTECYALVYIEFQDKLKNLLWSSVVVSEQYFQIINIKN